MTIVVQILAVWVSMSIVALLAFNRVKAAFVARGRR